VKQHNYTITDKFAYATICKCQDCGISRHYDWMPGWPGAYTYFSADGEDKLAVEPPCRDLPENLEEALCEITPLSKPMG
jgi:hypothetical protein